MNVNFCAQKKNVISDISDHSFQFPCKIPIDSVTSILQHLVGVNLA